MYFLNICKNFSFSSDVFLCLKHISCLNIILMPFKLNLIFSEISPQIMTNLAFNFLLKLTTSTVDYLRLKILRLKKLLILEQNIKYQYIQSIIILFRQISLVIMRFVSPQLAPFYFVFF